MKKRVFSLFLAFALLIGFIPQPALANDLPSAWVAEKGGLEEERVRVIVQLKDGADKSNVKARVNQLSGASLRRDFDKVINGFSAEIPKSMVGFVKRVPGVDIVTESKTYYPLMTSSKALTQAIQASAEYGNKGEGTVISIIDTGIDVTHKDMQTLSNPEKAKIKEPFKSPLNKDTEFNMKIPYGFNFADNSYYVRGDSLDHGMHVAGIAGANASDEDLEGEKGIDGVASEAQFLAMKVFSNNSEKKGAQDDDILAAIEASLEHKADIINMSLGMDAGFADDDDPVHRAIKKATDEGVLVVIAAGNEAGAFNGNKSDKNVANKFDRQDVGIVDSPSTARSCLSVASYENLSKYIYYMHFNDGEEANEEYVRTQGKLESSTAKLVYVEYGSKENFEKIGRIDGKVALIKRGKGITFKEKVINAMDHGAIGAVIFNNVEGSLTGIDVKGLKKNIFVAGIEKEVGIRLKEAIKHNPDMEVTFDTEATKVENDLKDDMSFFTSWGTTSELDFKPEITGVGGNVYSTVNDGKYNLSSGTSMASPHVAGASAVVLSQLKKDLKNIENYADFSKKSMINSSKILVNENYDEGLPFSPRRQGSGLIQVNNAIKNRVLLTMDDEKGDAVGALREFSGKKEFCINAKNYGDKKLEFDIKENKVQTTATVEGYLKEVESEATISADSNHISLNPGESKKVKISLDAQNVSKGFVEGFVEFISKDETQPNIHFSYMGFAGNWNDENILDTPDSEENKGKPLYSDTKLISFYNESLFSEPSIVTLGLNPKKRKKALPKEKFVSFSPNGDLAADSIIPQLALLRNASNVKFSVLNENHQVVRVLGEVYNGRRLSYTGYLKRVSEKQLFKTIPYTQGEWDGKVYDDETGEMVMADEGQYYLRVEAKLTNHHEPQSIEFPVKLDVTKPKIKVIKNNGKKYTVTEEGREINYTVEDDTGVSITYAKVGDTRYDAEEQEDGSYKVVIPFTNESDEKVQIYANDYAYNEKIYKIKKFGGNPVQVTNWKKIIDKEMKKGQFGGAQFNATTINDDTKYMRLVFKDDENEKEIVTDKFEVNNKRTNFASFYLKPEEQGRYMVDVVEYDKKDREIERVSLGEFIYDFTAPQLELENVTRIEDNERVKFDDPKHPEYGAFNSFPQYKTKLNPNGSVTFSGKVSDNVFRPEELKLTIGRNEEVKINKDGSFVHTFGAPGVNSFDFINLSQPGEISLQVSKEVDALDLAGTNKASNANKGLETTVVMAKYEKSDVVANTNSWEVKDDLDVNIFDKVILNKNNLKADAKVKVREEDGRYFYTLDGYTNLVDSKIFVNGEEVATNPTVDNSGNRFEKEVEIREGINPVSVRIEDKDGKLLRDMKVRILFDTRLPQLLLDNTISETLKSEFTERDGDKVETTYIETYKDFIEFKGKVKDEGFGYTLTINGDHVVSYDKETTTGDGEFGNNEKEFTKLVKVKDGSIINIVLSDTVGNKFTLEYIVRKVEKPVLPEETTPEDPKKDEPKSDDSKLEDQSKGGEVKPEEPKPEEPKPEEPKPEEPKPEETKPEEPKPGNPQAGQGTAEKDETIFRQVEGLLFEGPKSVLDGLDLRVEAVEDSKDLDLSKEYSTTMYKLRGYRDGKEVKALEKELVVHFPLLKKNFNGIYELGPDTHKREKFDYNEKNNVKYISLTINSLNDFLLTFDFADSNGMVQAEKSDKPVLNNDNQGTSSDVRDDHMEKNVADKSGDNGCIEHSKDEESESKSPNKSYPKTSDSGVGTYEAVVVIAIVTLALMKKINEKDIKESK